MSFWIHRWTKPLSMASDNPHNLRNLSDLSASSEVVFHLLRFPVKTET